MGVLTRRIDARTASESHEPCTMASKAWTCGMPGSIPRESAGGHAPADHLRSTRAAPAHVRTPNLSSRSSSCARGPCRPIGRCRAAA